MSIEPGGRVRVEHRRLAEARWIGDADEAERLTAAAEAAAKALSARIGEIVSVSTELGEVYNPTFNFEIRLEGHLAFRSAIKTALECLSIATTNGRFVADTSLDAARNYVLNGALAFRSDVGYSTEPALPELVTGLEHSVLLCQRADRSVYFEVSTYGGVVSVAGTLPPINKAFRAWLYRVDPATGVRSISHPTITLSERQNWSVDPSRANQERMVAAIHRVVALWQTRGDDRNVERIFNDAWTEVMTEPGKPITEAHVERLSRIIATRFVDFLAKTKRLD